jgi:hypothetical protein
MTLAVAVVCDRLLGKRSEALAYAASGRFTGYNRNAPYQSIRGIFFGCGVFFRGLWERACSR